MQAAVDAVGAGVGLAAVKSQRANTTALLVALTLLCHLESGLCVLLVVAARSVGIRRDGRVALLGGVVACLGQWHVQARYLLPGLAIALS